ncbi:geranyl transferase [Luteimonas viscosa]|uniref:Geranyl transferase n=1 Tax=Luteimonas viscosa TaxID=1132694 RepID=A0A5D4XTP1_9GAMM|nr:polyprenyl synthetase family protein [Luteimonas viscosa]TYT27365.1 geranyl transferase [Luteimonas viscosa]
MATADPSRAGAIAIQLDDWRKRADAALAAALDSVAGTEPGLLAAMRHAVLLGGKRMRPLLVYAAGHACGAREETLDGPAAAVELVHAYSLVHDDLPAMDDDALRRGQPTVHVAFDEATAILAGDALQPLAFAVLAATPVNDTRRVALLAELADAAGARGMCGGQALDVAATGTGSGRARHAGGHDPSRPDAGGNADDPSRRLGFLERLHAMKTGALLRAAIRLGAITADAAAPTRRALDDFAEALGLAFQIRDDLLDVEADSATLGKTAGKDAAQDKITFPALIGVDASRERLRQLAARMTDALAALPGDTAPLAELGRRTIERSY